MLISRKDALKLDWTDKIVVILWWILVYNLCAKLWKIGLVLALNLQWFLLHTPAHTDTRAEEKPDNLAEAREWEIAASWQRLLIGLDSSLCYTRENIRKYAVMGGNIGQDVDKHPR